jgi:hypothetical protein
MLHATPRSIVFFNCTLYESLTALCFKRDVHKKVYMQGMRLVFVLLEKLADPFSNWTNPNIGGNVRVKKTHLTPTKNHNHHYSMLNLWEN